MNPIPIAIGAGPPTRGERPDTTPEQKLAASSAVYETERPDIARSSASRMGVGSTTLLAIAAAVIVGVVLYGLNSTPAAGASGGGPGADRFVGARGRRRCGQPGATGGQERSQLIRDPAVHFAVILAKAGNPLGTDFFAAVVRVRYGAR